MRRLLIIVLLAASLLPGAGPVHAQATADQLNKLSLEALTAPPPRGSGGGGYARRSYRSSRRSYAPYRHSYARRGRTRPGYGYGSVRHRRGASRRSVGRRAYAHPSRAVPHRRRTY